MPPPHRSPRELFVISDLHLGGKPGVDGQRGFCINTHVPVLVQFLQALTARAQSADRTVELVINGDFFDFLAEETVAGAHGPWSSFMADPAEALRAYRCIRQRVQPFFDALGGLLQAGAELTVLIGNHDLELSLPDVRREFLGDLGAPRGGSVRFVYDGEAYTPSPLVLIEHGNRYDGFNAVDHDALRGLRSAQSRRLPLHDDTRFVAPPGSRLVEQVMNPIKRDYPFVDLLKPEQASVIPLLLALDPGLAGEIRAVLTLAWEAQRLAPVEPGIPRMAGHVGRGSSRGGAVASNGAATEDPLRALLVEQLGAADAATLTKLLKKPARGRAAPAGAGAAAGRIGTRDVGSWADSGWSLVKLKAGSAAERARLKALLPALRRLQGDISFDRHQELPEVIDDVRRIGQAGFRLVVFGHTHLAKAIVEPDLTYLNTGTWADLMRLPAGLFSADEATAQATLETFVAHLRTRNLDDYLVFDATFAHVRLDADGGIESAQLHSFDPANGLPAET